MALEPDEDRYGMFEAGHIFPLALVDYWDAYEFEIDEDQVNAPSPHASNHPINSSLNGMLFRRDAHYLFDTYQLSINPEDNYKITALTREAAEYIPTLSRPPKHG
ncbi:hypothetical protein B9Z19DRAFT_1157993 [Tuber borchii]|uniref:HNH nuclease domain-containing protein n=1 Tax=Tuber borchii TaxID=42251 RepID=A0A2T6ZGD7_TUBBO|nr:hypothetical protein B9Z19DRAFT_1157993 [Tuber borchii]